jgi:hypothetical protein
MLLRTFTPDLSRRSGLSGFGVLIAAATSACGQLVGISDVPPDPAAATMQVSGGGDVTPFVGTWSTTGGTESMHCPDAPTPDASQPIQSMLTFAKGTASDVILTGNGCTTLANVSDATASILDGQTCKVALEGEEDDYTYSNGSFTVGDDGKSATLVATGSVLVATRSGTFHCTFTLNEPYTKL